MKFWLSGDICHPGMVTVEVENMEALERLLSKEELTEGFQVDDEQSDCSMFIPDGQVFVENGEELEFEAPEPSDTYPTTCSCGADLTALTSVILSCTVGDKHQHHTVEYETHLNEEGELGDIGDLIANGNMSGAECRVCRISLEEIEDVEESQNDPR